MELKKTLTNLRKTKESFFNVKSDSIVYFDIYKNNLISKTKDGIIFKIHNTKFINKHFINWERTKKYELVIKTIMYSYWFEKVTDFYDIPFRIEAELYYKKNPFVTGLIKTL